MISTQRVHGVDPSIMFAERGPGYHIRRTGMTAEQMNYIMSGEMWSLSRAKATTARKAT